MRGLILAKSDAVTEQIAILLRQAGCDASQIYSNGEAIISVVHAKVQVVVADIDDPYVDGLAVLVWCKLHHPDVKAFALCHGNSNNGQRVAREFGMDGFFYLTPRSHQLDTSHGIIRQLRRTGKSAGPLRSGGKRQAG